MRYEIVSCKRCRRQYQKDNFNECPYCTGQLSVGREINLAVDEGERFTETAELSGGQTASDNGGFTATEPPRYTDSIDGDIGKTAPPPNGYYEAHIDTVPEKMQETVPPAGWEKKEEQAKTGPAFVVGKTEPPYGYVPAPAPQSKDGMSPNPFITVPVGEVIEPVVGWLVAIDGKMKGKDFSVKGASATIGRESTNKIQITGDDMVSRDVNCTIMYDYIDRTYHVFSNLNITNRVRLNGHEFYEVKELRAFDQLKIGSTTFVFVPLCGQQFGWGEERR